MAGLRRLTNRPDLFRLVNFHFGKYYADERTCREILLRLFGGSNADIAGLEGEFGGTPSYPMFSETYQSSIVGIAEVSGRVMNSWQMEIDQLSAPVTIIHGTDHPLTKIGELEAFDDLSRQKRIVAIQGRGHFIGVSKPM